LYSIPEKGDETWKFLTGGDPELEGADPEEWAANNLPMEYQPRQQTETPPLNKWVVNLGKYAAKIIKLGKYLILKEYNITKQHLK